MSSVTPSAAPAPSPQNRPQPPGAPSAGGAGFSALLDPALDRPEHRPVESIRSQDRSDTGKAAAAQHGTPDSTAAEVPAKEGGDEPNEVSPATELAAPTAVSAMPAAGAVTPVAEPPPMAVPTEQEPAETPAQLALAAIGGTGGVSDPAAATAGESAPATAPATSPTPAPTATGLLVGLTPDAGSAARGTAPVAAINAAHDPAPPAVQAAPAKLTAPGLAAADDVDTSPDLADTSAAQEPETDIRSGARAATTPAAAAGDVSQSGADTSHAVRPDASTGSSHRAMPETVPPASSFASEPTLPGHSSGPASQSTLQAAPAAPGLHPTPTAAAAVPPGALALHIAAQARAGRTQFDIQLEPAELGRVDVRMTVDRHGTVTSHVIVERAETLDLLRRDAPQLQRALDDAGLKTGSGGLQFSLRDHGPQHHDNGSPHTPHRRIVISDDVLAGEAARYDGYRATGSRGGLDIRV